MKRYDVLILGSGPAGQKAAIQAAKAGRQVAVVEQEKDVGGGCVHRGTIPSKTLRENALRLCRQGENSTAAQDTHLAPMLDRLDAVVAAHVGFISDQLVRNGVHRIHGKARFVSEDVVQVLSVDGSTVDLTAELFIIATGSRPRSPEHFEVDHEYVLDSDSVLSMLYLPKTFLVLGGGVIACEYASIFSVLGVEVTMIDKCERVLSFMDIELTQRFVESLERRGGKYLSRKNVAKVLTNSGKRVRVTLEDGETYEGDKLFVALGRVANVAHLNLEKVGISLNAWGHIPVDEHCRTQNPKVYAVGDVCGPPALASLAMEQGRRAVCHALGLPAGAEPEFIPMGIYTVPEMSSVGLTETQAKERFGGCLVGRANYSEVARGQIRGDRDGFLKLIADAEGQKLLGVHIVGDGATELIHVGQVCLISQWTIDGFVENIFNFPTYAEAYRIAALDMVKQRARLAS